MSSSKTSIRNSDGIVTLNVGGTLFTTCITTLVSHSSYFTAMFSNNWASERNINDDEEEEEEDDISGAEDIYNKAITPNGCSNSTTIFIDKDPIPFQYILNYMREDYINLPKDDNVLSKNIILQAQYFGMEDFLSKIKYKSVENCSFCTTNIFNVCYDDDDCGDKTMNNIAETFKHHEQQIDRYVEAFDQRYPTLCEAFDDGCLPYAYFEKYCDQINIQVGQHGEIFTVNRIKIMNKSHVFKEMIQNRPTFPTSSSSLQDDALFIDQDPQVFKYILDYIRYSQLNLPEQDPGLFRRILYCAEELGFQHYIIFVKARTIAGLELSDAPMGADRMFLDDSLHATVGDISNSQQRMALLFDQRFHSIDAAFTAGILPKMFFNV